MFVVAMKIKKVIKSGFWFYFVVGGFLLLLDGGGGKGVQASFALGEKAVLFKARAAREEDYQAYLLSHPELLSFMDYFQGRESPLQSQLLELLSFARQKDLQDQQEEAKHLYLQVMDLFFVGVHWNEQALSLFLFAAGRLYQLEKNKRFWQRVFTKDVVSPSSMEKTVEI